MTLDPLKDELNELTLTADSLLQEYLTAHDYALHYQKQSEYLYDKYLQAKKLKTVAYNRLQAVCDHPGDQKG